MGVGIAIPTYRCPAAEPTLGYVQDRGPGAGGPCYQWTRKERGKTVSVALSKEQFEAMREAIANWR